MCLILTAFMTLCSAILCCKMNYLKLWEGKGTMTKRTAYFILLVTLILCLVAGLFLAAHVVQTEDEASVTTVIRPSGKHTQTPQTDPTDPQMIPNSYLSQPFDARSVRMLQTNITFEDLAVEQREGDTVGVIVTGPQTDRYTPPTVIVEDGVLSIKSQTKSMNGVMITDEWWTVTVLAPANVLQMLTVQTSSGDVRLSYACPEIAIKTSSGDVFVQTGGQTLNTSTSSGNQRVDGDFESCTLHSNSGDLAVSGKVNHLTMGTSSGDMSLTGKTQVLQTQSSSGDQLLALAADAKTAVLKSSSGDIRLTMENKTDYRVVFAGSSGELHDRIDKRDAEDRADYSVGGGTMRIEVATSSGNVTIQ